MTWLLAVARSRGTSRADQPSWKKCPSHREVPDALGSSAPASAAPAKLTAEIAGCYELGSHPVFPFGRRLPETPLAIAEILRSRPKQTETSHDLPNHWPDNPAQPVRGRHRRGHGVHDVEPGA